MPKQDRLIFIAMNEINFEIVQRYVEQLDLCGFRTVLKGDLRNTSSETEYEELEPWIQWVSVQTGQSAQEHGIFRLGDIIESDVAQFFEQIEAAGKRVGAVSPMNAENRLNDAAYFIPDPWTKTPSDGAFWTRHLAKAISQAVNDNAEGKLTAISALTLAMGICRFARPRNYGKYIALAIQCRRAPWRKALLLDLFLNDLHQQLRLKFRPDFSMLFLNAGAHIQHHYMLNSKSGDVTNCRNPEWYVDSHQDPLAEMLVVYDRIIKEYIEDNEISIILATGLRQVPYRDPTFYYRLKDHRGFLKLFGIEPISVQPRMTRDFLIQFEDRTSTNQAERILKMIVIESCGTPIFEEVENRGNSLFVSLTYSQEIREGTIAVLGDMRVPLENETTFVAIKNGMHDGKGYAYFQGDVSRYAPENGSHVKHLHSAVLNFFGLRG